MAVKTYFKATTVKAEQFHLGQIKRFIEQYDVHVDEGNNCTFPDTYHGDTPIREGDWILIHNKDRWIVGNEYFEANYREKRK